MYDYGTADDNRDHYGVVSGRSNGLLPCVHLCECVWNRICVCVFGRENVHVTHINKPYTHLSSYPHTHTHTPPHLHTSLHIAPASILQCLRADSEDCSLHRWTGLASGPHRCSWPAPQDTGRGILSQEHYLLWPPGFYLGTQCSDWSLRWDHFTYQEDVVTITISLTVCLCLHIYVWVEYSRSTYDWVHKMFLWPTAWCVGPSITCGSCACMVVRITTSWTVLTFVPSPMSRFS